MPQTKLPQKDLVIEARELLAKATPGPWAVWDSCSWRRIGTREPYADGNVICPTTQSDGHPDLLAKREDLELAAAAPELLRQLCDEVERQRIALTKLRDSTSDMWACSFAGEVLIGMSVDDALNHAKRYDHDN